MNVILFDDSTRNDLLPLVYTRPVGDIRIGIVTIREKWEKRLKCQSSSLVEPMLRKKYSLKLERDNLLINGAVLPTNELVKEVSQLEVNEKLVDGDVIIAARIEDKLLQQVIEKSIPVEKIDIVKKTSQFDNKKVRHLWDVFQLNAQEIEADFNILTSGRKSQEINETNTVVGNQIFVEEGAKVSCSIFNTETGPIYIGKNAEVMEGTIVRGPLALCDHATLKLGTKIYGATTIGPHSKIGGEVNNSVVFGYSNKGHDGFMGNSVLGEWCNLGADTNTSNLKNNYGEVKVWNYSQEQLVSSGQQFVGLIMGDHSKSGINTMFNTGTVVGVCANVFGGNFPDKFIPSFSWGGASGFVDFDLDKAFDVAERVMARRGIQLSSDDREMLEAIFKRATSLK